ncbi:hypothetical protein MPSEU_000350600 [Mayamaea pseudoterrestris]|nr:hypothetical protein MPSEU_000350600 [Mayamaea pseudoterrestris]
MLSHMSIAVKHSQRTLLPYTRTLPKAAFYSPTPKEFVPEEGYYHGHLITENLEYLNDVIDKSVELQETVRTVKDSHAAAVESNKTLKAEDVRRLLALARKRNDEIATQIGILQNILDDNRTFAVDAPDGIPDWYVIEELEKVQEILKSNDGTVK